ncbi:MAG: HD-GYP domain-containing protein [bacterium]|nr:HD-GYP domain-containing protein [bacterium]
MTLAASRRGITTVYVYSVILAGALLLWFLGLPERVCLGMALFALLTFIAEAFPVTLPHQPVTVSVGLAAHLPIIILFGPQAAVWSATLATIRWRELKGQVSLEKVLFNRAQLAISAGLASWVYLTLGGRLGTVDLGQQVLPTLLAATTYLVVNMTAICGVVCLSLGKPFVATWRSSFRHVIPQAVGLSCLGVLFAIVYATAGPLGVVLFTLPLALARYALQQYVDLRDIFLATINALVSAIEAKDPYTHGHSTQTMEYALAIARRLGWSHELLERLQYACVLHDIGKIGIPDAILKKEDSLTPEEYEVQKRHPVVGADIVRAVKFLSRVVPWIRHHHERYDGRGYPDGLQGEVIPLGARVIAVADAFDAMTSVRPYRPALSAQAALEELRRNTGAQFDPQIVEAFLQVAPGLDLPGKRK